MKNPSKILFILIAFTFISCNDVQFKEAQPVNTLSLNVFPKEFRGTFISRSEYLLVDKHSFIAMNVHSNKRTINTLGDNVILKFFEGNYFLSQKIPNADYWRVGQIYTLNNELFIRSVNGDEEIEKMIKEISYTHLTNEDGDGIYKINPTKSEFKFIVDSNFFTTYNSLEKISSTFENEDYLTKRVQKTIDEDVEGIKKTLSK